MSKCIDRIHNNDTSLEEKTDEFNPFYMFSSKLLCVEKLIQKQKDEYESKYVILNEHIVESKRKAQRTAQRTQINLVESMCKITL